jgi:hypothetical protein
MSFGEGETGRALPPGVVKQVRIALRPANRLASFLGAVLGGGVPVASYQLAHHEVTRALPLWAQLPAWLVAGGLLFSALTVYQWGRLAFGSPYKALGFAVLLEGVLVASTTPWLSLGALGYLVAINGTACGCILSTRGQS